MRLSHFHQLMQDQFGSYRAQTLLHDHVYAGLGHQSAEAALEGGFTPRQVWQVVCDELGVPEGERAGGAHLPAPGISGAAAEPTRSGAPVSTARSGSGVSSRHTR